MTVVIYDFIPDFDARTQTLIYTELNLFFFGGCSAQVARAQANENKVTGSIFVWASKACFVQWPQTWSSQLSGICLPQVIRGQGKSVWMDKTKSIASIRESQAEHMSY